MSKYYRLEYLNATAKELTNSLRGLNLDEIQAVMKRLGDLIESESASIQNVFSELYRAAMRDGCRAEIHKRTIERLAAVNELLSIVRAHIESGAITKSHIAPNLAERFETETNNWDMKPIADEWKLLTTYAVELKTEVYVADIIEHTKLTKSAISKMKIPLLRMDGIRKVHSLKAVNKIIVPIGYPPMENDS